MNIVARKSDLVVQDADNETLVYDTSNNKTYLLNETSAFIWNALDGKTEIKTIAADLSAKTASQMNEELVWLAIEELKKNNLLDNAKEIATPLDGMNRREAIRRIGLATIIALPVVSALIAPVSAAATSLGACGAPCTNPSQCISNVCVGGLYCKDVIFANALPPDAAYCGGSPDCAAGGGICCSARGGRATTTFICPSPSSTPCLCN